MSSQPRKEECEKPKGLAHFAYQVAGYGQIFWEGVTSAASGIATAGALFGDEQAKEAIKQGAGAAWGYWPYLLGAMTPEDREKLAQAYETGDNRIIGEMMGQSLAGKAMTVEDAYHQLAEAIINFCADSDWDSAGARVTILAQMTQSNYWRTQGEKTVENDRFPPFEIGSKASKSALFLRNELLRATGQRIWGLTLTLYPSGKFKIEYDYDKPEGYEESDELISGEGINQSLDQLRALKGAQQNN